MSAKFRPAKQVLSLAGQVAKALIGRAHQRRAPSNLNELTSFFIALPMASRAVLADDVKRLIGWTSEAAAAKTRLALGETVNCSSAFKSVPGLAWPTNMTPLNAAYRVALPPFTGPGYYGLVLAMMDAADRDVAVLLVNRLFRLPLVFNQPAGVLTDVYTIGGLLFGIRTAAIDAAVNAALAAREQARAFGIPLMTCGQSMAGGIAQFQIAALRASYGGNERLSGFITFNAAHAAISIERLGLKPGSIPGINFCKDRDPGVGPHSLLPNRAGLQIYIHADRTGGFTPCGGLFSALLHPWEHFLGSFDRVCLGKIIAELNLGGP